MEIFKYFPTSKLAVYSIISLGLFTGTLLFIFKYPTVFSKLRKNKKTISRRNLKQLEACVNWKNVGRVKEIWIYPVKSCAGIREKNVFADKYGLKYKQFMDRSLFITDETGNMVNGVKVPSTLLITPELDYKSSSIMLQFPHLQPLNVNLTVIETEGKLMEGMIWEDDVSGFDCGTEVSDWLKLALGRRAHLLYNGSISPNRRHQDLTGESVLFDSEDNCVYANSLPYLLMNEASIEDLGKRIGREIPAQNFRPNIVVQGPIAYDEDDWTYIKIGDAIFRNVKPCARCTLTTIDHKTAKRDKNMEPLRTLKKYRCPSGSTDPDFGINLCVDKAGSIKEGDEVLVLRN